jgi:hypothetical protein
MSQAMFNAILSVNASAFNGSASIEQQINVTVQYAQFSHPSPVAQDIMGDSIDGQSTSIYVGESDVCIIFGVRVGFNITMKTIPNSANPVYSFGITLLNGTGLQTRGGIALLDSPFIVANCTSLSFSLEGIAVDPAYDLFKDGSQLVPTVLSVTYIFNGNRTMSPIYSYLNNGGVGGGLD